jgi:hypothetical protein
LEFKGIKSINELLKKGMPKDSAGNYIFEGTALFKNRDGDVEEIPIIAKIYDIPDAPRDVLWRLTVEKNIEGEYGYVIGEDDAYYRTKRDAMVFLKEILDHNIYFHFSDMGGYDWDSVSGNEEV